MEDYPPSWVPPSQPASSSSSSSSSDDSSSSSDEEQSISAHEDELLSVSQTAEGAAVVPRNACMREILNLPPVAPPTVVFSEPPPIPGVQKSDKKCEYPGCEGLLTDFGDYRMRKYCEVHVRRHKTCEHPGCENQVKAKGVCKRHGAPTKKCSATNCINQAVTNGVCVRHGAKFTRKLCSVTDCGKMALKGGVCCKHGAPLKRCSTPGCPKLARSNLRGMCLSHYGSQHVE